MKKYFCLFKSTLIKQKVGYTVAIAIAFWAFFLLMARADESSPKPGIREPRTQIPSPPLSQNEPQPPMMVNTQLTLEQAVTEGLQANLDLIAAKYSIPQAEADELTAGLWGNPSLQLDTASQPFGSHWDQTTGGGPTQYDLSIQFPVDLSGKHSTAKKSARQATLIAQAEFQDAVRQKVLQIRLGYVDVLTFDQQLGLSQEKEQDLNHLVEMLSNKIGNKALRPLVQRRAVLARDQARLDSESRKISLKAAKTNLALLLGRVPTETSIEAITKLRDFKIVDLPTEDKLMREAREVRPDLQALKIAVTKADADIDVAHSQVWDDFNFSVGLSKQTTALANPEDPTTSDIPGAYSWTASIQIPLPVFNRNQGNIQKAASVREQSDKQVSALWLSIHQELDSLYDQLQLNQHLIQEYESSQLDNARKVHDAEQTQFGTGNSALLDYFDAMEAYYDTLSSYYDSVGEYRRAVARLQASVGKDAF